MNHDFYSKHLRPFPTQESKTLNEPQFFGTLPGLFRAFEEVTGLSMEMSYKKERNSAEQSVNERGVTHNENWSECRCHWGEEEFATLRLSPGRTVLVKESAEEKPQSHQAAFKLAQAIGSVVGELQQWVRKVREDEGLLATEALGNLSCEELERETISSALQKIVADAAKMVDCQAVALYLLNDTTTTLKMRSCWGLPDERLLEPPRDLKNSLADMEALLGNAVILNELYLTELWQAPEMFTTSICVPVVSDNAILGTVWFYSDDQRDFSKREMTLLEMCAGRIAAELEKSYFQRECRRQRLFRDAC